jgi:7,8-dihydropterin-6-yl-methyl-4-(beta-D-ribofuranosyl)aminobenzene 5'-phosphate synthase
MDSIQALRVTTLTDNLAWKDCLGQAGLSFLLEFVDARGDDKKVIFDTSRNKEALMHNTKQLKVDLDDVDCVVLSHGHHDHTAATAEIVEAAGGIKVYAQPHTFLPRFHESKTGKRRENGVPKGEGLEDIERVGGEVVLTTKPIEVVPGVWTTGQVERATQFERALPLSEGEKVVIVVEGEEIEDQILDDQALWMNVNDVGPFVITGCAHAGLVNTLLQAQRIAGVRQIHGLVGGTHLIGRSEEYLEQTFRALKQFSLSLISPCHCTGFQAMARLWQTFPNAFVLNFCGRIIEAKKSWKCKYSSQF